MICPNCDFEHKFDCSDLIIDYDNCSYQCANCLCKFSEQESLDHDWDKMIRRFKDQISPETCLVWIKAIGKDRKIMESKFGQFGFESAFVQHFGIYHTECNEEIFRQLQRDLKIKDILE